MKNFKKSTVGIVGFMSQKQANPLHRILLWLSCVAILMSGFALIQVLKQKKVGVVRTADLVSQYKGMEESLMKFEKQKKIWQSNIDTLKKDYDKTVSTLKTEWNSLSKIEQEKQREQVSTQEKNLMRYSQVLEEQLYNEEIRLSEELLQRVNDIVSHYAKDHGFDVIHGATIEGSILYSAPALDVTDEILEILNKEYSTSKLIDTSSR